MIQFCWIERQNIISVTPSHIVIIIEYLPLYLSLDYIINNKRGLVQWKSALTYRLTVSCLNPYDTLITCVRNLISS